MYAGSIVRRVNGWTPMRIVRVGALTVEAVYCSHRGDPSAAEIGHYRRDQVQLVMDPVVEFENCSSWDLRLTEEDKLHLQRQRHITAKPLPWPPIPQDTQENPMSTSLYQTKEETPRFGTKLAINSAGKVVLEMKGTGDVETFAPGDIEKVMPYTVAVRLNGNTTPSAFLSRKGDVEPGDIVLVEGESSSFLGVVTAVNTQSTMAKTHLRGRKVLTTMFGPDADPADAFDALTNE